MDEVDDQLEFAALLEDADLAVDDQRSSSFDAALLADVLAAEESAAELGILVLDREVDVPRACVCEVGDLTADPEIAQLPIVVEQVTHVADDLPDGANLRRHQAVATRSR